MSEWWPRVDPGSRRGERSGEPSLGARGVGGVPHGRGADERSAQRVGAAAREAAGACPSIHTIFYAP